MDKISAVIITFNEERNIGRCIDSLEGVADEIIVVDSFSTDKTKEICLDKGVRFFQKEWKGYSDSKNDAANYANYNYILSLDADEVLSKSLRQSITEIKNKFEYDAYKMNRLNNYCGHWIYYGTWYPETKLRLWDKRKAKWEGIVHESVKSNQKLKVLHLKGDILHYIYSNISEHIQQINKFTDLSVVNYSQNGKRSNALRLIFNPIYAFIKGYFIKLGFLSGFYGLVISIIDAHFTFIKYAKLRDYQRKTDCNKLNEET